MVDLKYDEKGLIPVVTQDYLTKQVLMVAYMNEESYKKTLDTKIMHYFSRSRNELWKKGETSGHFQNVKGLHYDCDKDCLLALVEQVGVACHTGEMSCFHNHIISETTSSYSEILNDIENVVIDRKNNPVENSYTNYLLDKGIDKTLKKVGEETSEVIIAAKNPDKEELIYETADLLYHLSVLLVQKDVSWKDIFNKLEERRK